MKSQFVRYWGNSPLWREQTASWRKIYYMSAWSHSDSIYITRFKSKVRDTYAWGNNYKLALRGNWVLFTEDSINIYSDFEYKQLAEV